MRRIPFFPVLIEKLMKNYLFVFLAIRIFLCFLLF